jgi:hypothetical protein
MSIIATCGHTLSKEEGLGTTIAIKDYERDGSRSISYPTLCNKCLKWYRKKKLELKTKEEQDCWLKHNVKEDHE